MVVVSSGRAIRGQLNYFMSQAFLGLTGGGAEWSEAAEALFDPPDECQNRHLLTGLAALRDAAQQHCHAQCSVAEQHRQAQLHLPADTNVHSPESTLSSARSDHFLAAWASPCKPKKGGFVMRIALFLSTSGKQSCISLEISLYLASLCCLVLALAAYSGRDVGQSWCWPKMSLVSDI